MNERILSHRWLSIGFPMHYSSLYGAAAGFVKLRHGRKDGRMSDEKLFDSHADALVLDTRGSLRDVVEGKLALYRHCLLMLWKRQLRSGTKYGRADKSYFKEFLAHAVMLVIALTRETPITKDDVQALQRLAAEQECDPANCLAKIVLGCLPPDDPLLRANSWLQNACRRDLQLADGAVERGSFLEEVDRILKWLQPDHGKDAGPSRAQKKGPRRASKAFVSPRPVACTSTPMTPRTALSKLLEKGLDRPAPGVVEDTTFVIDVTAQDLRKLIDDEIDMRLGLTVLFRFFADGAGDASNLSINVAPHTGFANELARLNELQEGATEYDESELREQVVDFCNYAANCMAMVFKGVKNVEQAVARFWESDYLLIVGHDKEWFALIVDVRSRFALRVSTEGVTDYVKTVWKGMIYFMEEEHQMHFGEALPQDPAFGSQAVFIQHGGLFDVLAVLDRFRYLPPTSISKEAGKEKVVLRWDNPLEEKRPFKFKPSDGYVRGLKSSVLRGLANELLTANGIDAFDVDFDCLPAAAWEGAAGLYENEAQRQLAAQYIRGKDESGAHKQARFDSPRAPAHTVTVVDKLGQDDSEATEADEPKELPSGFVYVEYTPDSQWGVLNVAEQTIKPVDRPNEGFMQAIEFLKLIGADGQKKKFMRVLHIRSGPLAGQLVEHLYPEYLQSRKK